MSKIKVRRFFQLSIIVTSVSMLFWIEPVGASVYNLMKPVYHVYIDGEDIGTVDSKEVLNENIDELKSEQKADGVKLSVDNDVEVVTERLFQPSYDNKDVLEQLDNEISFVGDGFKLTFDGNIVGTFANEKQAKDAIWDYAKPFLSDKKVNEIERISRNVLGNGEKPHPADAITFSEPFSIEKVELSPDDIMTTEEGVSELSDGYEVEKEYEVEKDESLEDVANKFEMDEKVLIKQNDLSNNEKIQKGNQLQVLQHKDFVKVLETIEKDEVQKVDYQTKKKKSDSLLKGEREVTQKGEQGKKTVTYEIKRVNGKEIEKNVVDEKVTKAPVAKEMIVGTKVIPSKGTGSFKWPAVGGTITSKQGERWGSYHKGIDIAGVTDKTISTVDNGKVTAAGRRSGYGNQITVNHNNGMKTTYSHLASISVSVGDTVQKGDKIGVMGTTGDSTGLHLHFEVYKNGNLQNPMDYLQR